VQKTILNKTKNWDFSFCCMQLCFSAWGRTIALAGGYWAVNGGILDFFYNSPSHSLAVACGAYSIILGLVIFLFLYPVKIGPVWLGPVLIVVNWNYFPVGFVLCLVAPFCCVVLPTMMAGFLLFLSGLFYMVGGLRREKVKSIQELMWACGASRPHAQE
jgi:hypothetical protein